MFKRAFAKRAEGASDAVAAAAPRHSRLTMDLSDSNLIDHAQSIRSVDPYQVTPDYAWLCISSVKSRKNLLCGVFESSDYARL
eukprot:1188700-Rhodomonas_salina.1